MIQLEMGGSWKMDVMQLNVMKTNLSQYPAKPSYSHCVELGRTDDHFSTTARVKKTVTPPTDKTVAVLALVS